MVLAATSITLVLSPSGVSAAPGQVPPTDVPCEGNSDFQIDVGPYDDQNVVHVVNTAISPACETTQLGSTNELSFFYNDPISPAARRKYAVLGEPASLPFGAVTHASLTMRTADGKVAARLRFAFPMESGKGGSYNDGWASASSESRSIRVGDLPSAHFLGGGYPGSVAIGIAGDFQSDVAFCGLPAGEIFRLGIVIFAYNDGRFGIKYGARPCAGTTVTLATKSDFKQRDW
jgi:hypothetical protein